MMFALVLALTLNILGAAGTLFQDTAGESALAWSSGVDSVTFELVNPTTLAPLNGTMNQTTREVFNSIWFNANDPITPNTAPTPKAP
jgi:hypothetical protein